MSCVKWKRWPRENRYTTTTLEQQDFIFGSQTSNSFVFVGGVPVGKLRASLRAVGAARRLAGSVRNLLYRTPETGGVTAAQLYDAVGLREGHDDFCAASAPLCRHAAPCLSTDDGPRCDCPPDFEGARCQFGELEPCCFIGSIVLLTFGLEQNCLKQNILHRSIDDSE